MASPAKASAVQMTEAAKNFLDSLNPAQKAKAALAYFDGDRIYWHYGPQNQLGIALKEMNENQRGLAYSLMASAFTDKAYRQARAIIDLGVILAEIEGQVSKEGAVPGVWDPGLFHFTVFGQPDAKGPWSWRVQGHHLSVHFTFLNGEVISVTPLFFGANPHEVQDGPKKGLRILAQSQDLAFDLMDSLAAAQRKKAIINAEAPWDMLTFNATKAAFLASEGLSAAKMSGTQRQITLALITEYLGRVRPDLSQPKLAELKQGGLDKLYLAWAGPVEKHKGHYYRIAGGDFMIEFDNKPSTANHVHSVWRDVANDFGLDLLPEHHMLYHSS